MQYRTLRFIIVFSWILTLATTVLGATSILELFVATVLVAASLWVLDVTKGLFTSRTYRHLTRQLWSYAHSRLEPNEDIQLASGEHILQLYRIGRDQVAIIRYSAKEVMEAMDPVTRQARAVGERFLIPKSCNWVDLSITAAEFWETKPGEFEGIIEFTATLLRQTIDLLRKQLILADEDQLSQLARQLNEAE